MEKLDNKIVFITGGLSGIGLSCAIAAANEGATIMVADLKSENEEAAMNKILSISPKSQFIACNVGDYNEVEAAINTTVETLGAVDIALNNAGIGGEPNKTGDMTDEQWLQVININLNGVFYCMKHEITQMLRQKKGVIVNMSSILGKAGFATSPHYVAAKHGVIGLTQAAALEYAVSGIRVNAICPGFIQTPLLAKAGIKDHEQAMEQIIQLHPMKRLGKSEEVAKAFIYLASDDSSFTTGIALNVDGGYLAQ